jgi:Arc/MetJ-type ribon-helix-helix transcriptional regulator
VSERAISVRLDRDAVAALRTLTRAGVSRSAAIRQALLEAAARRDRSALEAEAAALASDEDDRREVADVAALMESLRAEG